MTLTKIKKFLNSKKGLYLFGCLYALLIPIFVFLLVDQIKENKVKKVEVISSVVEEIIPITNPESDQSVSVLFLGYGGAGHDGGGLTDSINVIHLDKQNKVITMIFIPRDLSVPIPYDWDNKQNFKINAAYSIGLDNLKYPNKKPEFRGVDGAGQLSKAVVSEVVGFPVNYYIAIDFSSFEKVIDILGGIEVKVPVNWDDYFYPIKGLENETCGFSPEQIAQYHASYSGFDLEKQFICRYEHLHFDAGVQVMNGETALKYIRSRHSGQYGGDFARGEKQHAVLTGIGKKIISLGIHKKVDPIWDQLTLAVRTDVDKDLLKKILGEVYDLADYKVNNIYLNDQNALVAKTGLGGQFILVPKAGENNFSEIQKMILGN